MKQFLTSMSLALIALAAAPAAAADFTPAACGGAPFDDVPANHLYCPWIDQLGADQITAGCDGGNYCPDNAVTRAQLAMLLEKAMRGTANWDPWRGAYRRTLIVNPILTGDPPQPDALASGQRLVALLGEITDNMAGNPYLLRLEPGVYDLGGGTLQLKPYVDVEGSGEGVTVIHTAKDGAAVAGADDMEIRLLTVENAGGGQTSVAFDLTDDTTRLTRLTALAAGGFIVNRAIDGAGDGAVLREVSAFATAAPGGGASAVAVYATGDAVLRQVTASAIGGGSATGVFATAGSVLLEDVTVSAAVATTLRGVSLDGASAVLRRVEAMASSLGAAANAAALDLLDSSATVVGGSFVALAPTAYGLLCNRIAGSHAVRVRNSRLAGLSHSVQADSNYEVYVADSQMSGGGIEYNGGSVTCFGAYGSNLTNSQLNACP